jgi:hypothetical protein
MLRSGLIVWMRSTRQRSVLERPSPVGVNTAAATAVRTSSLPEHLRTEVLSGSGQLDPPLSGDKLGSFTPTAGSRPEAVSAPLSEGAAPMVS